MRCQQGTVLPLTVAIALLASISAYTILMMARAQALQARFYRERTLARYAAEAGIVWAMQRLWNDPAWSSGAGTDFTTPEGVAVDIVMPSCALTPCERRQLQAIVTYQ